MRNTENFTSFDGEKLYLVEDIVSKPMAAVVIVHGLCEHLGRYEYLTGRLNAKQINVFRFDHRGHGKSGGKRVFYNKWTEISDDVNAVVDHAKKKCPNLPIFVIGHSMGGYAATCFATRYPNKVDGIILSGAMTRYNKPLLGQLPIDKSVDTYLPNELADGVCSDKYVIEDYLNDPLVEKSISVGLINTLGEGIKYLKENPDKFTDPVLIMHGLNDGLISYLDSCQLLDQIASKDKSLRVYAGMCHEIFNEYHKDMAISDALNWISNHLR